MQVDGYEIDVLVQGYPGKSVCHGGLGWSTVVLIRGRGHVAMIDTGGFAARPLVIKGLGERGLKPADVTDLLITHAHHDHCINWTLLPRARIVIGAHELDWAVREPWGETPVPELYVRELLSWPSAHRAQHGEEVLPGITAQAAPGHTPGHLMYLLTGTDRDVIFTGDAAKNRAEMICRRADATYDAALSTKSIEAIWAIWRKRPGSVLVPGHDMPMVQEDGRPQYIAERRAGINSWFGDDLETTTLFSLTVA